MATQIAQTKLTRRRFTLDEYHRMAESGILSEDDRVELVYGEIVEMSPINVPHALCVNLLNKLFSRQVPDDFMVSVQNPIYIDDANEPQPDLAILKPGGYMEKLQHPSAEDIVLLVEVADSTVQTDRRDKMPLYARAGISEAWIVNIPQKVVEIYRDPQNGKYRSVQRAGRGQSIAPNAIADVVVRVEDFLA